MYQAYLDKVTFSPQNLQTLFKNYLFVNFFYKNLINFCVSKINYLVFKGVCCTDEEQWTFLMSLSK